MEQKDNPYSDYEQVSQKSAKILEKILPQNILDSLKNMSKGGKTALIVLQNVPVTGKENELPATPSNDKEGFDKDSVSEYFMLGIAGLLGQPYLMKDEKDGKIIQQIIPFDPNAKSSAGSKEPFEYHTENAHEESPPEFFMLSCLKGDKNAKTIYFFLDNLIDNLSQEAVNQLQKPNFLLKTGSVSNVEETIKDAPLKKNSEGLFEIKLNTAPNRAEGTTPAAQKALDEVKGFFASQERPGVNLQEGDTMILQNTRLFHGREAFNISTTFENRRWLQRLYIKKKS
jgi:hypothetical protein